MFQEHGFHQVIKVHLQIRILHLTHMFKQYFLVILILQISIEEKKKAQKCPVVKVFNMEDSQKIVILEFNYHKMLHLCR